MSLLKRRCRMIFKALWLALMLAVTALDYLFTIFLSGKAGSIKERAHWLQRQCRRLGRALAIAPAFQGDPPSGGVLACNHLSYIDILVLGSRHPLVFLSKADVATWPVFGMLTKFAGTLFIRRELRSDVLRIAGEMPRVVDAGIVLAFFPEGTSTAGDRVLPFHASLFAPIAQNGWRVTPAFLRYTLEPGDGSVEEEVAYWRDMVFGPHLLNLLSKRRIHANVTYGVPLGPGTDRKVLSRQVREQVCLLGGLRPEESQVADSRP